MLLTGKSSALFNILAFATLWFRLYAKSKEVQNTWHSREMGGIFCELPYAQSKLVEP
jgi:hypothetical protein